MLHHAVHLMGLLPFATRAVYVGLGFPPHQRYIRSCTPQTNISSETLKRLWKGGLHGQRRRANSTNEKDPHSRRTEPLQGAKDTLACIPSQILAWVSQQMHARGSLTAYPTRPSRGFKDALGGRYRKRKEATVGLQHPAVASFRAKSPYDKCLEVRINALPVCYGRDYPHSNDFIAHLH